MMKWEQEVQEESEQVLSRLDTQLRKEAQQIQRLKLGSK